MKIPEVTEMQVWSSLRKVKRRPRVLMEYRIGFGEIIQKYLQKFATKLWNLSLSTQFWPMKWKRANINSLPKIDILLEDGDFRGINVTPVIVRAFEKVVYQSHVKYELENFLSPVQFAYREGGAVRKR